MNKESPKPNIMKVFLATEELVLVFPILISKTMRIVIKVTKVANIIRLSVNTVNIEKSIIST